MAYHVLEAQTKFQLLNKRYTDAVGSKSELWSGIPGSPRPEPMVVLSLLGLTSPTPPPSNRRLRTTKPVGPLHHPPITVPSPEKTHALTVQEKGPRNLDLNKLKEKEARERKEETNRKIASQKAISIILRREATKAVIEKKKGNSKKLLPRTLLEALHERITALRWESALKVFFFLRISSG